MSSVKSEADEVVLMLLGNKVIVDMVIVCQMSVCDAV